MAEHRNDCQEVRDDGVKGTYPFLSPEVRAPCGKWEQWSVAGSARQPTNLYPLPSPLQYMREQVYRSSTDVWSSMAVAVEMMTGKDPWSDVKEWDPKNPYALVFNVSGGNVTWKC